eukprot:TRINITY_DN16746_c0_g1_i1.p1 TRINITY_DN16746_c0_g1~~TRINITY_DN16746_c0_g1_i1.p1  ORF type:complete len:454 (+),score=44.04 TRINITY_DN16746_c0_g1_i1:365-1726(+)
MNNSKRINDPIHGLILLPSELFLVIDTPEFQRLRDIKQLGGMYFVFPGAVHNRFEHCLGTAYLAGVWYDHLLSTSPSCQQVVRPRDRMLVMLAGLCHDLGHGPFSHTFEKCFIEKDSEWEHEKMSCHILRLINSRVKILSEIELVRVENMILGKVPDGIGREKFLYQIVHNSEFEVDVDKFDYLQRDCRGARLPLGVDIDRIIKVSSLSDDGNIQFPLKESYNLIQLFSTRYALHKQVYSHSVVQAIELMIGDILKEKMSKEIRFLGGEVTKEGLQWYLGLTDSILREFERSPPVPQLLTQLRERKLYEMCHQSVVNDTRLAKELEIKLEKSEDLAHIITVKRNWCMGDTSPVSKIRFHPPQDNLAAIDQLLPDHFQEIRVRVFAKHTKSESLRTQVEELLSKGDLKKYVISTPAGKTKKGPSTPDSGRSPIGCSLSTIQINEPYELSHSTDL